LVVMFEILWAGARCVERRVMVPKRAITIDDLRAIHDRYMMPLWRAAVAEGGPDTLRLLLAGGLPGAEAVRR
jgi:hypothetical protein